MEGTNKAHENGEAMGFVGVRLTAQLGDLAVFGATDFITCPRWCFGGAKGRLAQTSARTDLIFHKPRLCFA